MFQDLENFIDFSECQAMTASTIGIAESGTDITFLTNYFISSYLKRDVPVILISFSQSFTHFNGIGNKLGISLSKARDQKKFLFFDGLKNLSEIINAHSVKRESPWKQCLNEDGNVNIVTLFKLWKPVFDDFQALNKTGCVIIVDSLTALADTGSSSKELISLVQLLKCYCDNVMKKPLIIGFQKGMYDDNEESDILVNFMYHCASMITEVKGLQTGSSKDIHGQILLSHNPGLSRKKAERKSCQFKLTDKGCALFAAGLSKAVV